MIIGILKREWAMRPPGINVAAIPDEATGRTILRCDRSLEIIVPHK